MRVVVLALDGDPSSAWTGDGEAATLAWEELGGKGKPTLAKLRSLK